MHTQGEANMKDRKGTRGKKQGGKKGTEGWHILKKINKKQTCCKCKHKTNRGELLGGWERLEREWVQYLRQERRG